MAMGQLNEHTPHCTQRLGSGKTHAVANVAYFSLSDLNQLKVLTMPSVGAVRGAVYPALYVLPAVSHQWERVVWVPLSVRVLAPRYGRALTIHVAGYARHQFPEE